MKKYCFLLCLMLVASAAPCICTKAVAAGNSSKTAVSYTKEEALVVQVEDLCAKISSASRRGDYAAMLELADKLEKLGNKAESGNYNFTATQEKRVERAIEKMEKILQETIGDSVDEEADDVSRPERAVREFEKLCDEFVAAFDAADITALEKVANKMETFSEEYDDLDNDDFTVSQFQRVVKACKRLADATGQEFDPTELF